MHTTLTPPSERILLSSIRWETYRAIARDCEQQPRTRLTYDQGQLEIRMPSDLHESYKKLLGRIVEALTEAGELQIRTSIALPFVKTSDLQRFLSLKSTVKENALIRQVREWAIASR